jgi:murein DD-endopeptidase MepM/ murein hydrolase activator NlpD
VISSPDIAATLPSITPTSPDLLQTVASTARPSPSPTATFQVCSPLQGVPLDQIAAAVSNPFNPPPSGSDDPHAGADISDLVPGSQMARPGMPIQAILPGQVAMAQTDRFPFGSAILIETSLDQLPQVWIEDLHLPAPLSAAPPKSTLTCPEGVLKPAWEAARRSLYVLYAHMLDAPEVKPGETMTCGQAIGKVGKSGNALNPHLHLEVRVGPAGARFTSIAHYDNSATFEEMAGYCAWSVSGQFQVIDPLTLLK